MQFLVVEVQVFGKVNRIGNQPDAAFVVLDGKGIMWLVFPGQYVSAQGGIGVMLAGERCKGGQHINLRHYFAASLRLQQFRGIKKQRHVFVCQALGGPDIRVHGRSIARHAVIAYKNKNGIVEIASLRAASINF